MGCEEQVGNAKCTGPFLSCEGAGTQTIIMVLGREGVRVMAMTLKFSINLESSFGLELDCPTCTLPSRKRAHGQYSLHWAKTGGWADIQGISVTFRRERAPR